MNRTATRRIFKLFVISLFVSFLIIGGFAGGAGAERKFVRFGGSNPGGSWFTIVGGLSAYLSGQLKDLNVTAIATGGSVDNNRQARKKNLDVWLTHSLTAFDNWNGVGLFDGKGDFKDIRLLCGVYENHHHFVVLDKSNVKSMADFKGKKVCLGSAGSGGAVNSQNIFTALGLWGSFTPIHLSWSEGGRALTDGQIEGIGMSSAPAPAMVTAEAQKPIRLIELTDAEFKTVLAKYPAYKKSYIKKGTYKAVKQDSPSIAFQVYMAGQKEADAESIYRMLKVAFDPKHAKSLGKIHKHLKTLSSSFEGMKSLGIPLHAGAVKFWKEKGVTIPKELIPPEM